MSAVLGLGRSYLSGLRTLTFNLTQGITPSTYHSFNPLAKLAMGFSLADIVAKMGGESENSTLNWDVVVNYKYVKSRSSILSCCTH